MIANTRPIDEEALAAKVGFVGPIGKTASAEWGFTLLQGKNTIKLAYASKVEAQQARKALVGNKNIFGVASSALFNAILQVVVGE
ncbi:MAG: hypothetical protein M9945_14385 [Aquamicrobium sp.]|uniref:hypothetical protein n=1 Tax=Aquamicrobium sp. TaxID=1872579 RepID=UPI00349EA6C4|nr:hypothetical protein [Aquamicrobium sp.]